MAEPTTTERNKRVQDRYDELMFEGKHGHYETLFRVVNEELALLSRQYEELRKALAAAEKALHPMFARVFNDNHDLTVNTLSFSYDEIVAAYFAYKNIKSALSSAPSPSETEKSAAPAEPDGWVRIVTLPDDLVVGDWLETIGGSCTTRARIEEIHHNEPPAGRGYCVNGRWLSYDIITAYRRTAGERK